MTSAFTPGARLGAYEIVTPIGAGGMGEVWQARDTRLGRDVALKFLPEAFAADPERVARFRREAKLLASLNHPNIAAIHGLEDAGGKLLLDLELVTGEDLAERLLGGPIPVDEALDIARQIVDALEEAHAKGIVHRDLKPGNVKLTPDGKVKVLDFGLAKAYADDRLVSGSAADVSQSPTLARSGTLAGLILGTAAYMAPEQAGGKPMDRRADIWAFGVVLFEMLTGRALFSGETVSDVLAGVIKDEPPWERLPPECPPAIVRLLRRCLRKRPRERLQDIGDARLELADAQAGAPESSGPSVGAPELARRRKRERWAWAATFASVAFAILVASLARFRGTPESPPALHFVLDMPEGVAYEPSTPRDAPAVSPDGRNIVFAAAGPGAAPSRLFIRSLVSGDTRAMPGTEGGGAPFWSPDNASVGFFATEGLQRLDLATGTVRRICSLPLGLGGGGTWSNEGAILFQLGGPGTGRVNVVSAAGGDAVPLTTHDEARKESFHRAPQFLSDGRRFLFAVASERSENAGLFESSLDSPAERRRISPDAGRALFTPGHLLIAREGTVFAQPFDSRRLALTREALPIVQGVASWSVNRGWAYFSVSTNGTLVFVPETGSNDLQLVWLDRRGAKLGAVGKPAAYGQITLSPDDKRVAAEIVDDKGANDLWIMDVARGVASRVTTDPAGEWDPVWSPDGRSLVFASDRKIVKNLYRKSLEGNEPEVPILESPIELHAESWTPDGKALLYLVDERTGAVGMQSVWMSSGEPGAKPELLLKNGFALDEPQVSSDGRWLTYVSNDSGQTEVYVQPFRRSGERVRVSVDGGGQPKWRRDGKELFYLSREGRVMAVATRAGVDAIDVGLPTELFDTGSFRPDYDDYAPSADGQRFLVKVPTKRRGAQIHVLLNWPSLLENLQRAGAGR